MNSRPPSPAELRLIAWLLGVLASIAIAIAFDPHGAGWYFAGAVCGAGVVWAIMWYEDKGQDAWRVWRGRRRRR